jgi:hypothetical protein
MKLYMRVNRMLLCPFAVVCIIPTLVLAALGQAAPANVQGLRVLSADYVPETDTIQFRVINEGSRAITAYGVDISLKSEGNTIKQFGHSTDLLNLVLNARCHTGAADSWDGAIKPGDTHDESFPAGLDKASITTGIQVHVSVSAIMWSDGGIQGEGAQKAVLHGYQNQRVDASKMEEKVIAILEAHKTDPDVQHRIGEVKKGVEFLSSIAPHIQPPSPGAPNTTVLNPASPVLNDAKANLEGFAHSPHPKEQLEWWSSMVVCRHQARLALLPTISDAH